MNQRYDVEYDRRREQDRWRDSDRLRDPDRSRVDERGREFDRGRDYERTGYDSDRYRYRGGDRFSGRYADDVYGGREDEYDELDREGRFGRRGSANAWRGGAESARYRGGYAANNSWDGPSHTSSAGDQNFWNPPGTQTYQGGGCRGSRPGGRNLGGISYAGGSYDVGGYSGGSYGGSNFGMEQREYGESGSRWTDSHQGATTNWGSGQRGRFEGRGPRGYRRSDDRIVEDINEALERHPDLDASEIDVKVQNGEVILSGTVDERQFKRMAEDVAERCSGVKDVRNEIRVQRSADTGSETGGTQAGKSRMGPSSSTAGQKTVESKTA